MYCTNHSIYTEWTGRDLINVLREYYRKGCICFMSNLRLLPVLQKPARDAIWSETETMMNYLKIISRETHNSEFLYGVNEVILVLHIYLYMSCVCKSNIWIDTY